MVYTAQNSADWGIAGVYVNGRLESTVTANSKNGWGGPAVELAYESDTPQELQVQISMLAEQESKQFQLLGVECSKNDTIWEKPYLQSVQVRLLCLL